MSAPGPGGRVPGRVTVLVNPASGGRTGEQIAAAAGRRVLRAGVEVDVVAGRNAEEARARARACVEAGADVLAVAGGDGMVHLALQEVAGTRTALAVLPAGTGNDFARVLGIPRKDPLAAAEALLGGVRRTIDLGRVTGPGGADGPGHWFGTVMTSGFDSLVLERANRMRWPRGQARYRLAILAELGVLRPRPFVLEMDGRREEVEATLIAVGNTTTYGGGMPICPHAVPDDGWLSVTVVPALSRAKLVRYFPLMQSGGHVERPDVRTFHTRGLTLETADMLATADGEPLTRLPVRVEAVPGAVDVIVPASGAGRDVGAGG
ncbi:diacylglycerol kinase [Streptomyces sp. WMMC897]|uniref:diacylglycerol kinase n=1 Tax=Streptomyces sp. WMMC897 TaxID=3014782 RepID=UPI0022B73241|nr:diacylglycerol kinase [Streptomyces sp. WMMC897]MCZ7416414.1 diacylglycerol kinase [Streptomyces sp. WMMC897]